MVGRRPAHDRHARGDLGDPLQDLLLGSHEGDRQQRRRLPAELRDRRPGGLLAGRRGVGADGRDADAGVTVGDQHEAGRAALGGDPACILEDAGGRRAAPQRDVAKQPRHARHEALGVVLRGREQDGQRRLALETGLRPFDELGRRSVRVRGRRACSADCVHQTTSWVMLQWACPGPGGRPD